MKFQMWYREMDIYSFSRHFVFFLRWRARCRLWPHSNVIERERKIAGNIIISQMNIENKPLLPASRYLSSRMLEWWRVRERMFAPGSRRSETGKLRWHTIFNRDFSLSSLEPYVSLCCAVSRKEIPPHFLLIHLIVNIKSRLKVQMDKVQMDQGATLRSNRYTPKRVIERYKYIRMYTHRTRGARTHCPGWRCRSCPWWPPEHPRRPRSWRDKPRRGRAPRRKIRRRNSSCWSRISPSFSFRISRLLYLAPPQSRVESNRIWYASAFSVSSVSTQQM